MFRYSLLLLAAQFLVADSLQAQIVYKGVMEQKERNGSGTTVKEFELRAFPSKQNSNSLFYQLDESRPALPWVERIGSSSESSELLDSSGVALGYRHLDRKYVIPVALPYFPNHDLLGKGASWKDEQGEFKVSGEEIVDGHECWEVKAMTGIARHHVLYVRKNSPLIQSGSQTVFMGPGDRFQIKFKITDEKAAEDTSAAESMFLSMKNSITRREHDRFQDLTSEQVQPIVDRLPQLTETTSKTPFHQFAKEISENVQTLMNRQGRVESLAGAMLGKTLPKFTLKSLKSEEIPSSSFEGKTVVLHFWNYANPTLEQPYGQVGYLDFIHNRWGDKNVLVYGVAINSELNDPQTHSKAIRNIQKLKQFMKLSYEITFDAGATLNAFGNPTRLGESLPLWIVISPDGNVTHYQTGFYEVDNRVGLKPLHDAIEKATAQ